MIKFKTLILIFCLLVAATTLAKETAFAQEGDALITRMFLISDNNVNCVSIINPEEVGTDSFLVFDYSKEVGIERNQPWTIAEKGKCYEIRDERAETENFYRVKIIKGDEREVFTDYSKFSPSDSIPDIFCNRGITENYCTGLSIDFSIAGPVTSMSAGGSFGYASVPHKFPDGDAPVLFPTKYQFYFSSSGYNKNLEDLASDPDFILAEKYYELLTSALNETLQSCDSHTYIEHQFSISHAFYEGKDHLMPNLENVIWHFKDGKKVLVRYNPPVTDIFTIPANSIETNLLYDIYIMGCKDAYINFVNENSNYISEIDKLAINLIKKYPNIQWIPIRKKEAKELSKLNSFISNESDNGYALDKEQFELLSKYQSEHEIIQTVVDGPSADPNRPGVDEPSTHKNSLLYLCLVVFTLIAGLVFRYIKHKKV